MGINKDLPISLATVCLDNMHKWDGFLALLLGLMALLEAPTNSFSKVDSTHSFKALIISKRSSNHRRTIILAIHKIRVLKDSRISIQPLTPVSRLAKIYSEAFFFASRMRPEKLCLICYQKFGRKTGLICEFVAKIGRVAES